MNIKDKKKYIIKYCIFAVSIFTISIWVAIITRMILMNDTVFLHFDVEQTEIITGMAGGIVAALSVGLLVYQLKMGDLVEEKRQKIQESDFLFRYNQAFINNPEMTDIEMRLDSDLEKKSEFKEIDAKDHQAVANYLVYLEGIAPLLIKEIVSFEYADDLMAYRFFLAVNNDYIEKVHIFKYPQYFLGCLKLYRRWEDYRNEHGKDILVSKTGKQLDDWIFFEHFADEKYKVRCLKYSEEYSDDMGAVARLIYGADKFIYPAAFGTDVKYAENVITYMINHSCSYFDIKNIYVAEYNTKVVGVIIALNGDEKTPKVDYESIRKKFPKLPESFEYTCRNHFNRIGKKIEENTIYLCGLCVDEDKRGEHIAKKLIGEIVLDNCGKDLSLHVLDDNESAISLYKKIDFEIQGETETGFAYRKKDKPSVYKMIRQTQKEDILATNDPDRYRKYFGKEGINV